MLIFLGVYFFFDFFCFSSLFPGEFTPGFLVLAVRNQLLKKPDEMVVRALRQVRMMKQREGNVPPENYHI